MFAVGSKIQDGKVRSILIGSISIALAVSSNAVTAQSLSRFNSPNEVEFQSLRLPWTSTNKNPDDLANQLEKLYLLLYNFGSLPVRTTSFEGYRTISDLAFDLGFVKGAHFPIGIDALLCDLNPWVCSRELIPIGPDLAAHPEQHVGGYQLTPGQWRINNGDTVNIVNVTLDSKLNFIPRTLPAGQSAIDVLSREAPDCSEYDDTCGEMVWNLNPYVDGLETRSDGYLTLVMPVTQVSALLPIQSESFAAYLRDHYSLFVDVETPTKEPFEFAGPSDNIPNVDFAEALNHIDQNLYRKARPRPPTLLQGNFDNLHLDNANLFELSGHPFRSKEGSITDLTNESIPIGVIDYWVDTGHCHLLGKVILIGSLDRKQINRATTCYEIASSSSVIDSHGTHIVGTITGGADGSQFIGLYPQAVVYFAAINPDAIGDPIETASTETNILTMSHARKIRVINISWDYPRIGNNDPIMRAVDMFQSTTLFVAASGNQARAMERGDSGCIWDPSCQSEYRDNIISVVALTASKTNPEVYEKDNPNANGSNYGTAFDIGATGEGVLSVVNGNRLGSMSGTSMAAPQVTAAAGLVTAEYKRTRPAEFGSRPPSPAQIKNRLMYTADIFPNLLGSVYSGRLNIERAMAINEVQVVFDDNLNKTYRTEIVDNPDMIVCRVGNSDQQIPWREIRRIATNRLSNSLVVFYEQLQVQHQPQTARLRRITDCDLRSQSNPISFTDITTNADVNRQLKDIIDLTLRL